VPLDRVGSTTAPADHDHVPETGTEKPRTEKIGLA
jgi:hypothetical protein